MGNNDKRSKKLISMRNSSRFYFWMEIYLKNMLDIYHKRFLSKKQGGIGNFKKYFYFSDNKCVDNALTQAHLWHHILFVLLSNMHVI